MFDSPSIGKPLNETNWDRGIPQAYTAELIEYWRTQYNVTARVARMNALPMFRTKLQGSLLAAVVCADAFLLRLRPGHSLRALPLQQRARTPSDFHPRLAWIFLGPLCGCCHCPILIFVAQECTKVAPLLTGELSHQIAAQCRNLATHSRLCIADANSSTPFHVVCPSLPGFGFSQAPPDGGTRPRSDPVNLRADAVLVLCPQAGSPGAWR